jgi:hypothetical protein
MKHLKTFEAYGQSSDIHEDIAVSILAELKKLQAEKGYYTVEDYEAYMRERGADDIMIDSVMNYLVGMDFGFDTEPEEELPENMIEYLELNANLAKKWQVINKKKSPMPDFEKWAEIKNKRQYLKE